MSRKEIKLFLRLVILMGINDLPTIKPYWSKDMMFYNTSVSSTMTRDHFLYNLYLTNNSLKPK